MYVDGKLSTLHHGDMAYVPKMTPHAFANLSDQPVRFLGTFTPSGFEKFFALAAEAGKAHTPGTPEYAAAMQKREHHQCHAGRLGSFQELEHCLFERPEERDRAFCF